MEPIRLMNSGCVRTKIRNDHDQTDTMLKDASRRKFDIVMAWAIDRVGRSLSDLLDGSCEPEKRKKVTPITDAAVLPLYPSRLDTDLGGGQS